MPFFPWKTSMIPGIPLVSSSIPVSRSRMADGRNLRFSIIFAKTEKRITYPPIFRRVFAAS